jgi:hypothetical protein
MKIGLAFSAIVFLSVGALYAQDDSSDDVTNYVKQLPPIFTNVCSANHSEVDAYAKKLKAFQDIVWSKYEPLGALETQAQAQGKINTVADTSSLEREFDRIKKNISQNSYTGNMDHALHGEAETAYKARFDAIIKKMQQEASSGDVAGAPKRMEADLAELHQAKVTYCEAASGLYIDSLQRERAQLENEAVYLVALDDVVQRINCKKTGYTYHSELSRKTAYRSILFHAQNMYLLLSLSPGDK